MSARNYLATFHTHLSALLSSQSLQGAGIPARMAPVPRALSSSCGTCVRYTAEGDRRELLDRDVEAVYVAADGGYHLLWRDEGPDGGGGTA